jgi:hypothetical protein
MVKGFELRIASAMELLQKEAEELRIKEGICNSPLVVGWA